MATITLLQNLVIGNQLALAWGDGTETFIDLKKLRVCCPCAVCQGEPDAMGFVVKPSVIHTDKSFIALRMQQVGGYALQLTWADGHSTGIYTFALLKRLG
ncbi:MAG: DUF971 domain-containing protein [Akkermansiaceae bacterium]